MTIPCALVTVSLLAAQPALTIEQQKGLSDKVVIGKVEEVKRTSGLIQKFYGRTDYEITVKLEPSGDGEPDKIIYKAFAMNYQAPLSPVAGPQGNTVPKRGQRVRLYLKTEKAQGEKTQY